MKRTAVFVLIMVLLLPVALTATKFVSGSITLIDKDGKNIGFVENAKKASYVVKIDKALNKKTFYVDTCSPLLPLEDKLLKQPLLNEAFITLTLEGTPVVDIAQIECPIEYNCLKEPVKLTCGKDEACEWKKSLSDLPIGFEREIFVEGGACKKIK